MGCGLHPTPSSQIGYAKTGAPVQASPGPPHAARSGGLTWVSGALPSQPRAGTSRPSWSQGPGTQGICCPAAGPSLFRVPPPPHSPGSVGAWGPQEAGQTALARPGCQRSSSPSCQGAGSGSWGPAGGGLMKAPDQVPVFPAGVQAQCHQSSLPTRGLASDQDKQPPGKRGQRPGRSRPTFLSSAWGRWGPGLGGTLSSV